MRNNTMYAAVIDKKADGPAGQLALAVFGTGRNE